MLNSYMGTCIIWVFKSMPRNTNWQTELLYIKHQLCRNDLKLYVHDAERRRGKEPGPGAAPRPCKAPPEALVVTSLICVTSTVAHSNSVLKNFCLTLTTENVF